MDGLKHLLAASSKKAVQDLFLAAFAKRFEPITPSLLTPISEVLSLNATQAEELLESVRAVINEAVYHNMTEAQLERFLGESVQAKLRDLIVKIVVFSLPEWREQAQGSLVSLPRLRKIDWRIDVKSASDSAARLAVPSVIVQFSLEQSLEREGRNIQFELGKDALEIMLEGLQQIKQQLASL